MQEEIRKKCDEIRDLLVEKNKSYGNSVFDKGVLFNVDPMYAIQARINDKLNRIKSKETYMSENDLMDLTGYLILLQVYMDEVDRRMSETIKSAEKYEENETPFNYDWVSSEDDETGTPI
jgi:hypothetical protein